MNASKHKQSITAKAKELGFFYCGFSEAGFLEDEVPRLENWLKNNRHGKMSYMENHFDKRLESDEAGSRGKICNFFIV